MTGTAGTSKADEGCRDVLALTDGGVAQPPMGVSLGSAAASSVVSQQRNGLPQCDGYIQVELSSAPIPYHFAYCFQALIDPDQCDRFAMHACRVACTVVDVVRQRVPGRTLNRQLTGTCISKLETMAWLVANHLNNHPEQRNELSYLPVMPTLVNGMMISPTTFEIAVRLRISRAEYWVTLVLKLDGTRWVCTLADLG